MAYSTLVEPTPVTIMFAFAGVFAVRNNPTDLYVLGVFGAIGYVLRKYHFDVAPLAMAFILGPEIERSVSQTISLSKGDIAGYILFDRPITVTILVLTPSINAVADTIFIRFMRMDSSL